MGCVPSTSTPLPSLALERSDSPPQPPQQPQRCLSAVVHEPKQPIPSDQKKAFSTVPPNLPSTPSEPSDLPPEPATNDFVQTISEEPDGSETTILELDWHLPCISCSRLELCELDPEPLLIETTIIDLPDDSFFEIAFYLDICSLYRFFSTCHRLQDVFRLMISNVHVLRLFISNILPPDPPSLLSKLRGLYPQASLLTLFRLLSGASFRPSHVSSDLEPELEMNFSAFHLTLLPYFIIRDPSDLLRLASLLRKKLRKYSRVVLRKNRFTSLVMLLEFFSDSLRRLYSVSVDRLDVMFDPQLELEEDEFKWTNLSPDPSEGGYLLFGIVVHEWRRILKRTSIGYRRRGFGTRKEFWKKIPFGVRFRNPRRLYVEMWDNLK